MSLFGNLLGAPEKSKKNDLFSLSSKYRAIGGDAESRVAGPSAANKSVKGARSKATAPPPAEPKTSGANKKHATKPAKAQEASNKSAVDGSEEKAKRRKSATVEKPARQQSARQGTDASVPEEIIRHETETQPKSSAKPEKKRRGKNNAAPNADSSASISRPPPSAPELSTAPTRPSSSDSAEKLARTVFVGNLPPNASRAALRRLFASHGSVESVRLRSIALAPDATLARSRAAALRKGEADAARGSGHAYVVFGEAEAARSALGENMRVFSERHLRVDRAAAASGRGAAAAAGGEGGATSTSGQGEGAGFLYDPARTVFVGNVPVGVEDEDLVRFFTQGRLAAELGPALEAVRVVRDPATLQGKGIAFALFHDVETAKAALLLEGESLGGRPLRIKRARAVAARRNGAVGKPAAAPARREKAAFKRKALDSGPLRSSRDAAAELPQKKHARSKAAPWQGLQVAASGKVRTAAGSKAAQARPSRPRDKVLGRGSTSASPAFKKATPLSSKHGGTAKKSGKRPAVLARKLAAKKAAR